MTLFKKSTALQNRNKSILKHIGLSSFYKFGSIIIGFLLVPLSISYLGSEQYGLWLTLFSFVGWFSFFDFGIGHGLRNKLTEALAKDNFKQAKIYVSTAYISVFLLSVLLVGVFFILYPHVNWGNLFNSEFEFVDQLVVIVFIVFSINLLLKLITIIYYSNQNASAPGLFHFLGQILTILGVLTVFTFEIKSLVIYGSILSFSNLIILLFATLFTFFITYKHLSPSIFLFESSYVKDIFNLGGKFFIIQISATILYATDNFIINYLFGGAEVTTYNLAFKYFSILTLIMSTILMPYWSAFTDAYVKGDLIWIKSSLLILTKLLLVMMIIGFIMIVFSDKFYSLWVGEQIEVPYLLTILMGMNTMIMLVSQLMSMTLNGIGKVKLQMYLGLFGAVINIPLSIFFASYLNLGISGIILATLISNLLAIIIFPLQVYKIINKTAKGIWNA